MTARITRTTWICLAALLELGVAASWADERIVLPESASRLQQLAGQEVRRYIYLRTGRLPQLTVDSAVRGQAIVVAGKDWSLAADPAVKAAAENLKPQEYLLKTTTAPNGEKTWWIVGGDDLGTLYGAYRFAENLGVRFYLHGDVIPDGRLARIPDMDETGKPLFGLRGVNPWGSHPFGFDAWGTDDYKAIFTQLAKMRMNFLGIHCYPEGHPYAEPTVWHGLPGDFDAQGRVKFAYPSHYYNTLVKGHWGPILPKKTSDYSFGGSLLFDRDDWAPEVMRDHCPVPKTPEDCNEVFDRMAAQFREAFGFARRLGVKTCIGTEVPMIMPKALQDRLKAKGRNPADPAVVQEVYEGTFRRIMASHPLDYYWLWTPEGWTWGGNKPEQYAAAVADVKLAQEALKNVKAPFKLATAGWVLGPAHDRAAFDRDLPKDVPMSAISRNTGADAVDPAFGRIAGREKWAIPWLESDNREGLAGIQLFAGRMRRDAADALAYGCTGLMGLHWRTDILSPNIAALAQAAWDQTGWTPSSGSLPGKVVPTVEGPIAGSIANYPGRAIANTTDAELYQTCRYDMAGYNLKLPNGRYRVTLKFCEPHFDSAGKRIGSFKLQGKTVIEDLDIFARIGMFAAMDLAFDNIEVTDGWLRLGVEAKTSLPCISAIVVEGAAATRKINCGGPAHNDYEADDRVLVVEKQRHPPCDDFYADWARAHFGSEAADDIAKVFTNIDGRVPQVTDGHCPSGSLPPDVTPWSAVAHRFAFVDELEQVRSRVRGAGNLDRFDYWLNTMKYCRSLAQVRCALGAKAAPEEITRLWGDAYRYLLVTVNTPGGLAMVVNMENHPGWGALIAKQAPQPWPKEYQGKPRLIVPCVRSVLEKGETLTLKLIAIDQQPVNSVSVRVRSLGKGAWQTVAAKQVARAVWHAQLTGFTDDFEYFAEAQTQGGQTLRWPATAPELNQTVVTMEK